MAERLMTIAEVAEYLSIPVGTLRRWRVYGNGPAGARLGNHVRYKRTDVDAWVAANTSPLVPAGAA